MAQRDYGTRGRRRKVRRVKRQESFFNTGLVLQEPCVRTIRVWLGVQVASLLFQYRFWQEVSGNLELFEETLRENCAAERLRHGVCVGPMWNISAWQEVILQGKLSVFDHEVIRPRSHVWRDRLDSIEAIDAEMARVREETAARLKELQDKRTELQLSQGLLPVGVQGRSFNSSYIFQFQTESSPSVFLLSVDPVSRASRIGEDPAPGNSEEEHLRGHWSLEVRRVDPPANGPSFQRLGTGFKVFTIEDLSQEAQQAKHVVWEAILRNGEVSRHRSRFVVLVEDFKAAHADQIHAQCSLTSAWTAFNRQHQGHHHRALCWCRDLLAWLLPMGLLTTWAVYAKAIARSDEGERDLELTLDDANLEIEKEKVQVSGWAFQTVILVKLVVMDIPQQICIVLYMLGWYDSDGLRCQLCLFHPSHCGAERPFGVTNSAMLLCTLLSSVTNQLILGPSQKGFGSGNTEDEVCSRWTVRIGILCVSVLPFTSGVFWASPALLSLPVLMKVVLFLPCVFGWFCVIAGALSCLIACCGDL